MALVIVLLVLILTLAFFYLKCTFMQSLITLWSSIVATILAFSYYETVANLLISRGYGLQWSQVGCYMVVFITAFAVLRSVCEYLIGLNVDLGEISKTSAAVLCGLLTGIILSGNLLVAMGLLPLQGKVFYSRFNSSEPVDVTRPETPSLSTDAFVSGLYGLVSSGSMGSNKSFNVLHADYLNQIHLNKLKSKDKILPVCSPQALEIPSKKGQQPVRFWTSPDNEQYVVVRMGIRATKITDGGASNAAGKLQFFPAQIRLIAKDKAADTSLKGERFTGSAKVFYPVGFIKEGFFVKADLDETISPETEELKNRVFWVDAAFEMSQEYTPILLQFRLSAVADLTSYNVVKSTLEIENALDGIGLEESSEGSQSE